MTERQASVRAGSPEIVDLTNESHTPTRMSASARRKLHRTGTYIDLTSPVQSAVEQGASTSASSNGLATDVEVLFELRRTTVQPSMRISRAQHNVTTVNLVPGRDIEVVTDEGDDIPAKKPRSNLERPTKEEEPSSLFCPICLETYAKLQAQNVTAAVVTACSHVFCKKCIEEALKTAKSCPKCRRSLRGKTPFKPLFF